MFYKISNLCQPNGSCNYKGLSLDNIIGGRQVYPHDFSTNNMCLVESTDDKLSDGDLTKITEEEYNALKQEIISAYPAPQPTQEEEIAQLKSKLKSTQDAVDFLLTLSM